MSRLLINSNCSDNLKLNVNVQFRKENLEAIANILHKTAVEVCFFLDRLRTLFGEVTSRERDSFTPHYGLSISVRPMRTVF